MKSEEAIQIGSDRALWLAFEKSEIETQKLQLKRTILFAACFSLLGFVLDFLIYPEFVVPFFICRCIAVTLLLATFIPLRLDLKPKLIRLLSHWPVSIPISAIMFFITYAQDGESTYYAGLNLVLVGASLILRWRFIDSVINASLCLVTYLGFALSLPGDTSTILTNAFFIMVTAVFACAGTFFYSRLRYQEFLLRHQLDANRQELEENNAKLQALDEAKTRFFANISHELRTPLTLILGPVEQLKTLPSLQSDPKASTMIETLSENGYRLLRLINDLLDLVRLDTGDIPLRPENLDLPKFLDLLGISLRPMAETQQISLQIQSKIPKNPVQYYDRDKLEKIILNLSINALKFTPAGGKVSLNLREEDTDFILTVSDTGKGMTDEDLERIFERFWQADASSKRKARGTGIGLALVKSLTERLNGKIDVKSSPGMGTTFTLRFPSVLPPSEQDTIETELHKEIIADEFDALHEKARLATASPPQHQTAQAASQNLPLRPSNGAPQLLVVDDESSMRQFIVSQLEDYEILEASDGKQGWELAKQHLPDLIVLDFMMPEMDGMEVCRLLRKHPPTSRIPIVLVTAHAGDAPRLEALQAGVNDFLTKPFSSVELRARIRNLLITVQHEREIAESNTNLTQALVQLQENEEQLVRAEKLTSLGRMSAGIIHEVNNPLNYAKTSIHLLKSYRDLIPAGEQADYDDTIVDLNEGVQRVIDIITDLRAFTRGDETTRHLLQLHKVVANTRRLIASDLGSVSFTCEVPEDLELEGNDNQLCQAFINLIQNALHATADQDDPKITFTAQASPAGGIVLQISDNGIGISAETQSQIFDPFFTTRDVGDGMGLGLSLTLRIIEEHRAKIHVESELGNGATFIIYFPPPKNPSNL